jgi:hypothetical protein
MSFFPPSWGSHYEPREKVHNASINNQFVLFFSPSIRLLQCADRTTSTYHGLLLVACIIDFLQGFLATKHKLDVLTA